MTEMAFFNQHAVFTTREYSTVLEKNLGVSSRRLKALADRGDLILITRGIWGNKNHQDFSPYGAIPYLLDNEQGYLSFLSALHRHGLVSQIPNTIQIATTGRGRTLKSSIGEFQFFKIKPELMREGVDLFKGGLIYNMATPEKALADTFYIATKKGHRFKKLPEIELSEFKEKKFFELVKSYPKGSLKMILDRYMGLQK